MSRCTGASCFSRISKARTTCGTAPAIWPERRNATAFPTPALAVEPSLSQAQRERIALLAKERGFNSLNFSIDALKPDIPPPLRKFVGVWMSDAGMNGGKGRNAMLVTSAIDAGGQATGWLLFAPGGQGATETRGAATQQFSGAVADQTLAASSPFSDFTVRPGPGNTMVLNMVLKDGLTSRNVLKPVWLPAGG